MTSIVGSVGSGAGRRLPKEKKSQSNKINNSVINNSIVSQTNDHNNHNSDKLKLDPKLQVFL
jgi:hypothetical protein